MTSEMTSEMSERLSESVSAPLGLTGRFGGFRRILLARPGDDPTE
jgi:hypothetical protein